VDVAKTSVAAGELDNFISRRHEKRVEEEGERPVEEMWAESEWRHAEQQREELCHQWLACARARTRQGVGVSKP
jgi:hypothetical protein